MPIRITCDHCSSQYQIAEQYAGKRVRCRHCNEPIQIPVGDDTPWDLILTKPESPTPAPPGSDRGVIDDGVDWDRMSAVTRSDADDAVHSNNRNGHVASRNGHAPPRNGHDPSRNGHWPEVPRESLQSLPSQFAPFAQDCLWSWAYALRCVPGMLVLFFVGLVILTIWLGAMVVGGPTNPYVLTAAVALTMLGLGVFHHFYLTITEWSRRDRVFADPPELEVSVMFADAWRTACLLVVYAAPIVTLPMLPMALLAMAHTRDSRAFDLEWAARSAWRCMGQLALVWGFIALYGLLTLALLLALAPLVAWLTVDLMELPRGPVRDALAVTASAAGTLPVAMIFGAAVARCIGVLGKYNDETVRSLPRRPQPLVAAMWVLAGAVVGTGAFLLFQADGLFADLYHGWVHHTLGEDASFTGPTPAPPDPTSSTAP